MTLSPGSRLGPYEILGPLGEGGMGVVYKARDTRLGRTVAIKLLKTAFSERFNREARAVSALNHPHICALYDVGDQDGSAYLVMEYVEGESLAARVRRGALPLDQTMRFAVEIAGALEEAHGKGILHRDLKPANIMLTKSGTKLLDFGLAKSIDSENRKDNDPTQSLSVANSIIGTPQYMAPEQLEGKGADARTDIFSFGLVLYEMLTGKRAFDGESLSSLIAAIIKDEPRPILELQPLTPEPIDRLIRTAIAKDPGDRWQSARELRHALEWMGSAPKPVAAKASRPWAWIGVASVLAVVCAMLAVLRLTQRVAPGGATILSIVSPESAEITNFGSAISPDGKLVVFTAESAGIRRLWIRPLNSSSARVLEGTDEAVYPFWSPDSKSIGFFAVDKLKRIDLDGGAARVICQASNGRGGAWSSTGTIVFAPALSSPLSQVSAAGGAPEVASAFDAQRKDTRHNFPQFLPDGRSYLVYIRSADPALTGTYAGSLDRPSDMKPVPDLVGNNFRAVFAPIPGSSRGYLIYYRDGAAFAQIFDSASLRLDGTPSPIPIREAVTSVASPGFIDISASNTGILLDGGSQRSRLQLMWRGRDGSQLGEPTPPADYFTPRLSPDNSRVAYASADPRSGEYDLWIYELATRIPRRFTFSKGLNYYPVWSPDGRTMVYSSDASSRPNLYRRPVSGAEAPKRLVPASESQMAYDWSSDGRFISYGGVRGSDPSDVMILPTNGDPPFAFLHTPGFEGHGQFHPGPGGPRWIAYTSAESGEDQVYVRRFRGGPAEEAKWQISIEGGAFPRWRGDGQELFYVAKNGKMMAAALRFSTDSVEFDPPKVLFEARLPSFVRLRYTYDVSRDGKRFLLMNSAPGERASSLSVLLNWQDALAK